MRHHWRGETDGGAQVHPEDNQAERSTEDNTVTLEDSDIEVTHVRVALEGFRIKEQPAESEAST